MRMADPGSDILKLPDHHVVETERLRLRTIYVSDAEVIMSILSSEEVMRWTSSGHPITSLTQAERWLKDRALGSDVSNFAIELRSEHDTDHDRRSTIGIIGSFHWPRIGYIIHPGTTGNVSCALLDCSNEASTDHTGKGYASEALRALMPALFERMPSASKGGLGFDHIEALTASQNWASRKVLQKCGFTYCEIHFQDFENPVLGLCDTTVYKIARPGTTLEELGLLPQRFTNEEVDVVDQELVPPIQ